MSITFSTDTVSSCVINSTGSCSGSATVPLTASGGYPVEAIDQSTSTFEASSEFTVVPGLVLDPSSGTAGTQVEASVGGFEAAEVVEVDLGTAVPPRELGTCTTDTTGSCDVSLIAPGGVLGPVTVWAVGQGSDLKVGATFTEDPGPAAIALSRSSGPAGLIVDVGMSGYTGADQVELSFDGTLIGSCVTGSDTGACTTTFTVPQTPSGSYEVTASDGNGVSASSTFGVISSVSLSPPAGQSGSTLAATANGFEPAENVSISYNSEPVGSCIADSDGDCSVATTVPTGPLGSYLVTAVGSTSGYEATATFAEAGPASLVLGPGGVDTDFTATASGFDPGEVVTVTLDSTYAEGCIAGTLGACSVSFQYIYGLAAGDYPITATGSTSGLVASAIYKDPPSLDTSPNAGAAGSSFTVGGYFAANETVALSLGSSTGTCTTNSSGQCLGSLVVPSLPAGTYDVIGTDASGDVATALFEIEASASLSASSGPAASAVTVAAHGFEPGEIVDVSYGTSAVGSCIASSDGSCSTSFVVPAEHAGSYVVTATGSTSGTVATTQFKETPTLATTPISGAPGTTVAATVQDFAASENVNIWFDGPAATLMTSCTTDSSGECSADFIAPSVPAGTYWLSADGSSSGAAALASFEVVVAPTITQISPPAGPKAGGSEVLIWGANFAGPATVLFGDTAATVSQLNSNLIVATSPPGTGTVDITVITPEGTTSVSPSDTYTYLPVPTVSAVRPRNGPLAGGSTIDITGTGFASPTEVLFGENGDSSDVVVLNKNHLTARVPAGVAGSVALSVQTYGGSSANSPRSTYSYLPVPTVSGVTPASGSSRGGTVVTISGTGFAPATNVLFGEFPATTVAFISQSEIRAVTPASAAGTVNVTVVTGGGTSAITSMDTFRYERNSS